MSTQTEAMKRWVEVFDGNWHDEPVDSEWADRAHQALAEMRQAIAEADQPAQQNGPWCMKMNGCKTKCEDCPDEVAEQPAQPLTDEQIFAMAEAVWRHGWASCRDAEYVGEEAESERWGEIGAEVVQNIAAHGITKGNT